MNENTIKRFWTKVTKTDTCWLWNASKRAKGYGAFVWADEQGRIVQGRAHRFMWLITYGEIPRGLCVLHHCDVPNCVRPDHLFLGTKADNNRDMMIKGRKRSGGTKTPINLCHYKRGKEHHAYKFADTVIAQIRIDRTGGLSYSQLVKKYHISIGYCFRVCNSVARRF